VRGGGWGWGCRVVCGEFDCAAGSRSSVAWSGGGVQRRWTGPAGARSCGHDFCSAASKKPCGQDGSARRVKAGAHARRHSRCPIGPKVCAWKPRVGGRGERKAGTCPREGAPGGRVASSVASLKWTRRTRAHCAKEVRGKARGRAHGAREARGCLRGRRNSASGGKASGQYAEDTWPGHVGLTRAAVWCFSGRGLRRGGDRAFGL